jgi:hypothetical protein
VTAATVARVWMAGADASSPLMSLTPDCICAGGAAGLQSYHLPLAVLEGASESSMCQVRTAETTALAAAPSTPSALHLPRSWWQHRQTSDSPCALHVQHTQHAPCRGSKHTANSTSTISPPMQHSCSVHQPLTLQCQLLLTLPVACYFVLRPACRQLLELPARGPGRSDQPQVPARCQQYPD